MVSCGHKNQDGSCSILNVVAADEYVQNIDDNVFTNASAIESLKNTIKAATILGEPLNIRWVEISEHLLIHTKNGITQNYKGYDAQIIKQVDVNLLGYPLHVITEKRLEKICSISARKKHSPFLVYTKNMLFLGFLI